MTNETKKSLETSESQGVTLEVEESLELPYIFKLGKQGSPKLSPYLMKIYLQDLGFGQYMTSKDRTAKRFYFRNDNNILRVYSESNIREVIIKELNKHIGTENETVAIELIDLVLEYSDGNIKSNVMSTIHTFADFGNEDAKKIKIALDSFDKTVVRFANGVVIVTKDDIVKIPYAELDNQGAVWESAIIDRNVELVDSKGSLFEKFCLNAMRFQDKSLEASNDNWVEQYPVTDVVRKNYDALRSSIGYLINRNNETQKCVVYIDRDSNGVQSNGRNGKTVIMKSLQHFTDRVEMDGKQMYNDGGVRFCFSTVTPWTGLVHIDETDHKFKFENLFSVITGEMKIEKKNKDKFSIPEHKKPKIGITTNYILQGSDASYTDRQHLIEFGNYWRRCTEEDEHPRDEKHLGKWLFGKEFTEHDWNQFYMFGFECIKLYHKYGLIDGARGTISEKRTLVDIAPNDPDVQEWIYEYVKRRRLDLGHNIDGVQDYALYQLFVGDVGEDVSKYWNKTKFLKTLFQFVSRSDGYEYNPDKSHLGNTLSRRRWLKGTMGQQESYVKIVSDSDPSPSPSLETKSDRVDLNKNDKDMKKLFNDVPSDGSLLSEEALEMFKSKVEEAA